MARPGITYQDVASAAQTLKGQEKNVTIENVRAILGTGSIGTINQHLRKWKEVQLSIRETAANENLPDSLIMLVKGLWQGMLSQSTEQFAPTEASYQQEIAELKSELEKYKSNNQRWQKMFNQWQQEKASLANENLTLEQATEFAHKEIAGLQAKQEGLYQQLQEKQDRIDELHRLHQQTQNNLEHYREAAREERLKDQRHFEYEKQHLQVEVKNLSTQFAEFQKQYSALQQQSQLLQQSFSELESDYQKNLATNEALRNKLEQSEKNNIEYLKDSQHWQNQFKIAQQNVELKISALINSQSDIKMLTQHLADTKQLLQNVQDQNKLVANEKWVLAQEKAQLKGQIDQLQKMITV